MGQDHGIATGDGIEVRARRMTAVREQCVVVTETADPLPRPEILGRLRDPAGDVGDGVVGRAAGVDRRGQRHPEERRVVVGLDETGDHRALRQVEHGGLRADQPRDLPFGTERGDPPAARGQRADPSPRRVEGEDGAAERDEIGCTLGIFSKELHTGLPGSRGIPRQCGTSGRLNRSRTLRCGGTS